MSETSDCQSVIDNPNWVIKRFYNSKGTFKPMVQKDDELSKIYLQFGVEPIYPPQVSQFVHINHIPRKRCSLRQTCARQGQRSKHCCKDAMGVKMRNTNKGPALTLADKSTYL